VSEPSDLSLEHTDLGTRLRLRPTALNLAHPVIRRRHRSASAPFIWRHSSSTFNSRSAATVSAGDIEASTRSMASMARVYGEFEGGGEGGLPPGNTTLIPAASPPQRNRKVVVRCLLTP
jgi:hypothetical protein